MSHTESILSFTHMEKNIRSTTEMPATFLPVVAGGRGIYVEEDVTNFSNLSVDDSADGVGTKAIIKDAVIQSTSATEDQFKINDHMFNELLVEIGVSAGKRLFRDFETSA